MIADNIVHQRENSEDTETHLQENISQYESDAVFLLGCMIRGERLTAKTVVTKYGKEPRRLRDLEIAGKCSKRWVCNDKGKRQYVEFYVDTPKVYPTKKELTQWLGDYLAENKAKVIPIQKNLFP